MVRSGGVQGSPQGAEDAFARTMNCPRTRHSQVIMKVKPLRLGLLILLTIGVTLVFYFYSDIQAKKHRVNESLKTLEAFHANTTNVFWKTMYGAMIENLSAKHDEIIRHPCILSSGLLMMNGYSLFIVYWGTTDPKAVESVIVENGANQRHVLDIPSECIIENQKDLKEGVIAFSDYRWPNGTIPDILFSPTARVKLCGAKSILNETTHIILNP